MSVFERPDFDGHETVAFAADPATGLRAVIAVHSTALGPACGGCRMWAYANGTEALDDALRLSRGMTYKSAMAGLPLGGGKAVILGDPKTQKSEPLLGAFARAVNDLGGRYVTAQDVGMSQADLETIARHTPHAAGFDQPGRTGGDSGPMTALGVFLGLKAAVREGLGTDRLKGVRVAIQGTGKVGATLAQYLADEGAVLSVADVSTEAAKRVAEATGARVMDPAAIVTSECDVLSPNALGAILSPETIPALKARVVAGGANNQLASDACGALLRGAGILYAPDYVINAGGIIRVAGQIFGWADEEIERRTRAIPETLGRIFARAKADGRGTHVVADRMAREIVAAGAARRSAA